jgi:ABC-type spermidine/putrescine transport system permease subunit I
VARSRIAPQAGIVGEHPTLWKALALPGVLWLLLLFVTPFYAILSVAMGRLDPIFLSAIPEFNPYYWDPSVFTDVFSDIFGGPLGPTFLRTIVYVAAATTLCILIGYPVAYYVARRAGRWKGLFLLLLLAPFWINYLMRMLAWVNVLDIDGQVNGLFMSLGILQEPRNWLAGHHETVILGLVYGYIPWFILPLYAALDRIDKDVLEAARDLGAGPFRAFARVTLPLSKQGILAGTVIITLPMFGDYYTPDLLSGSPRTRMIGNDISLFILSSTSAGGKGAALTIVLMLFVAALMTYYLFSVARATREAGG